MNIEDFFKFFSPSRINRYLEATSGNNKKTVFLYKANLMLAKSFHPLIGIVEVILRNRLNDLLRDYFDDRNWIFNEREGFMSHHSLIYFHKKSGKIISNFYMRNEVDKAVKRLVIKGERITSDKVIAEQSFGFWTDLFALHHYKLLAGKPIQIFEFLPANYGRKEIYEELNKVKRFRNRINHNEPICFSGSDIDFSEARNIYTSIMNLLSWIDPILISFIHDIDSVNAIINSCSEILK